MSDFKLNFIHLCDQATFSQEGKLSLTGIFDVVNVVNLPGSLLKAVLVCNFTVLNTKLDKIKIDINISKDGETEPVFKIPPLTAKVTKPAIMQTTKETKLGLTIQLGNLVFKTEGIYEVNINANGELIGKNTFEVKKMIQSQETNIKVN